MDKILIGSRVLNLKHCDDYDYLTIDNEVETCEVVKTETGHLVKYNINHLNDRLNFKLDTYYQLSVYQLDKNINREASEFNFDILTHIEDIKVALKKYVNQTEINIHKIKKFYYNIAYIYYIAMNESIELTERQLQVVQYLHDKIYTVDFKHIINDIKSW